MRVPSASARNTAAVLLLGIVAALLPPLLHRQYFSGDAIGYALDAAQLQFPRYVAMAEALQRDHVLPMWQNLVYGGSPFHANPEHPTLYPPVVLLAAFCSPLWTINLTILLHLSLCGVGMYLLCLRLWRRVGGAEQAGVAAAGAFVAAVCFALNLTTRTDHLNLVAYGAAHALFPFVLLAADGVLFGERPRRSAAWLALALSLQVFTGGLYVVPYTTLVLVLWFVFLGLCGGAERRRRTLTHGVLAAVLTALIVCAKALPYLEWLPTTNRGGDLSFAEARGITFGIDALGATCDWDLVWTRAAWRTAGGWALLPALFALPLLRHGIVRVVFALLALFFAVGLGGTAFRVLYEVVPPFDQIRDARRAWVAINALWPLAAGLGTCWLVARVPGLARQPRLAALPGLALGLGLIPALMHSYRFEAALTRPESFRELLTRYPVWTQAAELAGDEWRAFWLHHHRPDGKNEQFISSALGVETPAGYLGHVWPRRLERHLYLPDGAEMPPRLRHPRLGMLSVRWFVTNDPAVAPRDPPDRTVPPSVDGSAVFDNTFARPRAFLPGAVCGIFGDVDDEVLYALQDDPRFPTRTAALVAFDAGDEPSEVELEALDAVVLVERPGATLDRASAHVRSARARGAYVASVSLPLGEDDAAALGELVTNIVRHVRQRPSLDLAFERLSTCSSRIARAEDGASPGRFVVVSEPWALYRGWRARGEGGDALPIRRADGVVSAVYLEARTGAFTARYAPWSVTLGLVLGAIGALWALRTACTG
jgi:hypothetical protein